MGMVLSQKKFTHELLTACPYNLSRVTSTPLPTGVKLLSDSGDLYDDPALYRCLVGKLNFLTHTRLDLAFAVQTLSQFMHAPRVLMSMPLLTLSSMLNVLLAKASFSRLLLNLLCKHIVTQIGIHVPESLLLVMFCSLVSLLSAGNLESNLLFQNHSLKLNTEPWLMLLQR